MQVFFSLLVLQSLTQVCVSYEGLSSSGISRPEPLPFCSCHQKHMVPEVTSEGKARPEDQAGSGRGSCHSAPIICQNLVTQLKPDGMCVWKTWLSGIGVEGPGAVSPVSLLHTPTPRLCSPDAPSAYRAPRCNHTPQKCRNVVWEPHNPACLIGVPSTETILNRKGPLLCHQAQPGEHTHSSGVRRTTRMTSFPSKSGIDAAFSRKRDPGPHESTSSEASVLTVHLQICTTRSLSPPT